MFRIETLDELMNNVLISHMGKKFFSTLKHPDLPWVSLSLQFNVQQGLFPWW
jgi:hypothetical protein